MAMISFKRGPVAKLPTTYNEGTFYVTTDERAMYLDVSSTSRIRLGDFQEFANVGALDANKTPSTTALYYVKDINCLAKWDGAQYVQINRDTGMTSVEVTGAGNAVTAAVYSKDGRKLTLTKGATYVTAGEVDAKLSEKIGAIDGTVKKYVDDKTAGIASDESLKGLTQTVTTLVGDDAGQSARQIAAAEVAKIVAGADPAFDTLKEIADWISGHKTDAASMNSAIKSLEAIVKGIGGAGEKATVVAYVQDAIAALKIGDYAKAADLTALAARVTSAEGAINVINGEASQEGSIKKALADAKGYADGLAKNYDKVGAAGTAEANAKKYADGLAGNYDTNGSAAQALADAKSYADGKLEWGSF